MQMRGHVVSMYVATCGQNGPGLGSDEKEIILLVYVIIDAVTNMVIGIKQYLVKPSGVPGRERCNQSQQQGITAGPVITNAIESPATITATIAINNINNINNNNNIINNSNNSLPNTPIDAQAAIIPIIVNPELPIAVAQAAGKLLNEAIEQFDAYIRSLSIDPESSTDFKLITDGQLPIRQCLHPEACAKDIELPSYYLKFSDLRKEYVRYKSADLSRALVPVKDIKKLPQMPALPPLPLSIADIMKELDLPSTEDTDFYIKESRDMVTVIQSLITAGHKFETNEIVNLSLEPGICSIDDQIDGSCIVRARGLPWQSSDQDIAKFFRGLNVAKGGVALCLSPLGRRNGEALVRFVSQEHRDMALKRHKHHIGNRYIEVYRATGEDFLSVAGGASNEAQAFLSKGAQVIIRMRGLPYDCTAKQVLDFFTAGENPCNVLDGNDGVLFVKKPDGRATGDAFVLFANETDAPHALQRHRESIGQRYIELFRSTTAEVQQVLNRSMDPKTYEQQPPLIQLPPVQMSLLPQHVITSGTTKNCIRLRGLPYEARVEHILHFLDDFAKNIIYQGVHMVFNAQGQPSGEAFIQMDSEDAARLCAQQKHNQFMVFGKKYRYIEVFQCSGDDMNLVLNGGLQSPGNPTKPALLSPGMLPQAQQARPQTVTHPHLHHSHHSHHHPQSAVVVSAAAVAAAVASQQNQHSHFTTANSPAGTLTHYALSPHVTAAAGGVSHHSHIHPHHPLSIQAAAAAAAAAQNIGAHQPPPLTLSIPPPNNSALLAQQQAQYIAQQSLLARQNAAAAAAAAQSEQFLNYHNFALMPSHSAAATQIGLSPHHSNAAAAVAAAGQQQYFFMPRPYLHHPMNSLGLVPSHQFHPLQFSTPSAVAAAGLQAGISQPIKRSYDNAFHQDVNAVSAPKRQLTRPPGGTLVGPPFGAFSHFGPSSILPPPPPHRGHPGAYYPPQLVYWPYPSPPVSPTTYFGPAPPPPPHVAQNISSQHQALYPVDFIPSPTTYHHNHIHTAGHQQSPPIGSPPNQPSSVITHQQFPIAATAVPSVSPSAVAVTPAQRPQSMLTIDTTVAAAAAAAVSGTNQKFTGHHHLHHHHHHVQTNGHILSPNATSFALATAGSTLAAVPTLNSSHYVELYIA